MSDVLLKKKINVSCGGGFFSVLLSSVTDVCVCMYICVYIKTNDICSAFILQATKVWPSLSDVLPTSRFDFGDVPGGNKGAYRPLPLIL